MFKRYVLNICLKDMFKMPEIILNIESKVNVKNKL